MLNKKQIMDMIIEIDLKIDSEIEKVNNGKSKKNIYQLNTIKKDLSRMKKFEDINIIYTRFIIDSWEQTDALGNELIELESMYIKFLKKKSMR